MKIFITGSIRSGTTWVFSLLESKIPHSFLERFDLNDLVERKKFLSSYNQFIFKINEDVRKLNILHTTFPSSKVVVLVRHPLEVIYSMYKPNKDSIPYRPFIDIKEKWSRPNDESYLCAVIRRFESYFPIETLNLIQKSPDWLRVFYYEGFLKKFDFNYAELMKFVELEYKSKENNFLPQKTPNQGVRLKEFSESEKDMIMGSDIPLICKQLGYMDL